MRVAIADDSWLIREGVSRLLVESGCTVTAAVDNGTYLLRAVAAVRENWRPIRLPLASSDPNAAAAQSLGFVAGWTFDMLLRSLDPDLKVRLEGWRYAGIDYI